MAKRSFRRETQVVRGGADLSKKDGPMTTPIYQTSTFEVTDNAEQLRVTSTDHFYTRYGNPTNTAAEKAIAELEATDAALLFSSGMAAITTSMLALVKAGDHIVAQRDIYGGVTKFLSQWLPKMGVETTFVDTNDIEQHERAIRPNTRVLHVESPTNPSVRVVDLEKIAALARKHRLISTIDATFCTPINCRPAEWGIDLVLHSGTKYFGGHADLICGVATGRRDLIDEVHYLRTTLGCCMDPHAAFLLLRGIKTLAVRVERQNASALQIAEFLSRHPKVARVHYPMLAGHPDHALAKKYLAGAGGVLTFEVAGSGDDACRVAEALSLFTLAPSLGGVESLVSIPVLTSHAMIDPELRRKMGVTEQMIRLSVGIENVEDLIADLERALRVMESRDTAEYQVSAGRPSRH
ncbi:MAG TPA: aminotransferase class I/II-fold pyridoxal phosphate-dependent enzyme [Terriglobales bacterium]|nr:aminotransferase class I/II-fold pyridoxal phosphate-dependent enzyme [Terriglobales bacterium]